MPRVDWGVSAKDVDNYDRESQYKPYDGPLPVNGVYQWQLKSFKHVAGTRERNPQLRVGLELVPRKGRKDERKYAGYFVMVFAPVTEKTQFRYVPFLDAIGVTGREFERATITDEEGNIKKIGKWRNTGEEMILGQLRDNTGEQADKYPKDIGWVGALTDEEPEEDDDDLADDDDDEFGDDEDGEEIDDEDDDF